MLCSSDAKTVRVCTVKEQAALQTFPESFVFPSNSRQAIAAIGNAVPPAFAETVAKAAMEELDKMGEEDVEASPEEEPVWDQTAAIERLRMQNKRLRKRVRSIEAILQRNALN